MGSAVAQHSSLNKTKYGIFFEDIKITASNSFNYTRNIREAIAVNKGDNTYKKDDSRILARAWRPVWQKLRIDQTTPAAIYTSMYGETRSLGITTDDGASKYG